MWKREKLEKLDVEAADRSGSLMERLLAGQTTPSAEISECLQRDRIRTMLRNTIEEESPK